jgi:5-methylcytosine-specific restriction endonuclease McrA
MSSRSKTDYWDYLQSTAWRDLRKKALERDKHKCRACGGPAEQVHHSRYPKVLGKEKLPWLYSVCVPCHGQIHSLAAVEGLERATRTFIKKARKQRLKKQQREHPRPAKSSFGRDEDWREYAAKLAKASRERRRAA